MQRSTFLAGGAAALCVAGGATALAASDVSVLYAGSLVTVMEHALVPALAQRGLNVLGEPKGSVALANLISSGLRRPDVFLSADPKLFGDLMKGTTPFTRWYATFATTRLVIGYAPSSPFAHDFVLVNRGQKALTDVLLEPGLKIGRTDPALDPKGYRSIIAAKLLGAQSGKPDFAVRLLGDDENAAQILPEEALLARLESGELDAAFLYATEAVSRKVPEVELPASANLGDPAEAATYATQSVTVKGVTRVGAPAAYAIATLAAAPHPEAAAAFTAFLFSKEGGALLEAAGVTVIRPRLEGDRAAVPPSVLAAIDAG